jgi:5-methylcytosine-specific restriction endonuclease McrA
MIWFATRVLNTHNRIAEVLEMLASQVLVLNASYEPLQLMGVKRAVGLVLAAKAHVIEAGAEKLHSASCAIDRPVVIRLSRYVNVPYRTVPCTRRGIMLRDNFTCQYCGDQLPAHQLTLDHIVPRARGGRTTWENTVAACRQCNGKKADQTLHSARMTLRSTPIQPTRAGMMRHMLSQNPAWERYLFS